jgi:hypothetical protein
VETANVRMRNRFSGSSGSCARRSAKANPARATTAITAAPITSGESHAYVVPPHAQASSAPVTPTLSSAAPR